MSRPLVDPRRLREVLYAAIAVLVAAGPLLRAGPVGPALGIVAVSLGALAVADTLGRSDRVLFRLLAVAFLARIGLAVLDAHLGLFPKLDAVGYHLNSEALATAWWSGNLWPADYRPIYASYEAFHGLFYYWFGSSMLLARTVNSLVATLVAFNVFRIGREIFDRRAGLVAAAIFALLPSIVRLNGEHLRDTVVILLVTQVLFVFVAGRFRRPLSVGSAALGLVGLVLLRRPTFVVLLVPLAWLGWAHVRRSRPSPDPGSPDPRGRTWSPRRIALVGGLLAAGVGFAAWTTGANLFFHEWLDPATLTEIRDAWARGGSRYLDVTFNSWLDVVAFAPVGAIYFLFTPFPWQVETLLSLVAAAENLVIIFPVTALALATIRSEGWTRERATLILLLVVASIGYGLVEGNVGTVLRHRAQFTWVLFVFAGPSIVSLLHQAATREDPDSTQGVM